jgi:hypothetical protein
MGFRFVLLISIVLAGVLQAQSGPNVRSTETLKLEMVKSRQDQLFPKSRDYIAVLTNEGTSSVSIEAIQMPGGYGGSGQFYACSVQLWKRSARRWVTPRPAKLAGFGRKPHIIKVEISPGNKLEVCNSLLPQQQGRPGDSVRFALSLQWEHEPTLFSNKFTIDGENGQKK